MACTEPLTLLHRDAQLVVIDKPPGLLVHRTVLDRHETRFAVQMLRDQIGQRVSPVHRLDRGTSGLLVFALDSDTARTLSAEFATQRVSKTYLAVVRGWPAESGTIDYPLKRQADDAEWQDARAENRPQEAVTHWRRLATVELPLANDRHPTSRYALLELTPETGRRHQIRRHLKHIAHPIIGDATYGKGPHNRAFAAHTGCARLLLHCAAMSFAHPADGAELHLTAPLTGAFRQLLQTLGWQDLRFASDPN
ncbi:MAG: pseudouridylate synthase [Zoogloeaceae bacterium]|nr:pseudouridylate synthase [Zoogloeaceae bacterium]